jgi:LDH2 family malate/lactate/ureidoglycolate dehydrogenase
MDAVIREIRESERMEGVDRIWLPGEMEYHSIHERMKSGIPLSPAVADELKQLAGTLNLSDRLD